MTQKEKVLILCTGNSCRSQMAEGVLRHYGGDKYDVYSADSQPSKVNETAVSVMHEIGIDISNHKSQHLDEFREIAFDYVITVCDNAKESCPLYLKAGKKLHWSFPDPPHNKEISEAVRDEFRKVRDSILQTFKKAGLEGIGAVTSA